MQDTRIWTAIEDADACSRELDGAGVPHSVERFDTHAVLVCKTDGDTQRALEVLNAGGQ